jgi:hypothetical protein
MSQDSSASEVTGYWQDDRHFILGRDSLLSCPSSYPEGTRNFAVWVEQAEGEADHSPSAKL